MGDIYDTRPGDVFWAASDIGWAVGHSYIAYAPLFIGAPAFSMRGSRSERRMRAPSGGSFPSIRSKRSLPRRRHFRAIKKEDPKGEFIGKYDLSSLKYLFLAGERADTDTIKWAEEKLGVPVIDHWWQTESGWPMAANPAGLGHAAGQIWLADRTDAGL